MLVGTLAVFLGVAFYPRGFVAVGGSALVYRFPFRRVQAIPWEDLRTTLTPPRIECRRSDRWRRARLPTMGLSRVERERVHDSIDEYRRSMTP